MVTVIDERPEPEYLAMVAMIESGIFDKENYSRTQHWNNKDDEIHKFWDEFNKLLRFYKYKIIDSRTEQEKLIDAITNR